MILLKKNLRTGGVKKFVQVSTGTKWQIRASNPEHLAPGPGLKYRRMSPLSGVGVMNTFPQVNKTSAAFHFCDNGQVTNSF